MLRSNLLLLAIALLLLVLALENARPVEAQSGIDVFIEPGSTVIRDPDNGVQVQGKVVIDRRTGDVWGFPTLSNAPYPVVGESKEPPVSKPVYLGRFDFAGMAAAKR